MEHHAHGFGDVKPRVYVSRQTLGGVYLLFPAFWFLDFPVPKHVWNGAIVAAVAIFHNMAPSLNQCLTKQADTKKAMHSFKSSGVVSLVKKVVRTIAPTVLWMSSYM